MGWDWVDGLTSKENTPKPARTFAEALILLVDSDTAFAMEVSQTYRTTNVKVLCDDQTFMDTLNLLEIELSSRAHEDDEEKRGSRRMLA